jgi:hypothetical protein
MRPPRIISAGESMEVNKSKKLPETKNGKQGFRVSSCFFPGNLSKFMVVCNNLVIGKERMRERS